MPDKNVKELGGRPLIGWTIESALGSRLLDRVVVSTDSERIAGVARGLGAEVPFMRPAALAADDSAMLPVLCHALETLNLEGGGYDTVVCLQPTSPFRSSRHVDEAVELYLEEPGSALVSACPVRESPWWMLTVRGGRGRAFMEGGWRSGARQSLPSLLRLNGAIYVLPGDIVCDSKTLPLDVRVYEMAAEDSVDIDTEADWALACAILERRQ